MAGSAEELRELLVLEELDLNLFRGPRPRTERQRVFGGQVAAQAVVAATRTVDPELRIHSLHSYFLRPGDPAVPIIYDVERIRDGRSLATRRVLARKHGRPIFYLSCSLQVPEEGLTHQDRMPDVIPPDMAVPIAELVKRRGPEAAEEWQREWSGLDARYVGTSALGLAEDPDRPARAQLWLRVDGDLGENELDHTAAFAYASDLTLIGAALVPHDIVITSPRLQAASLDHAVWFHRPFRADEWWLYDQVSPFAGGGRGLSTARVFTESGELVATVAQEGLIRVRKPRA